MKFIIYIFLYLFKCDLILPTDSYAPANTYLDDKVLEKEMLNDASNRLQIAAASDVAASSTFDNILNLDAATDAEIKAEASRRVAEAAAKIAAEEEIKAKSYAGLIKNI